ncbi:metallophosphoesterase [Streptomyces sp. NPDC020875]|uniref:metallophosphoesterase n=1 Tax=Streptomyces sp. NPDC020875 TaxID=3154898 RepID=UPI0033F80D6B
MTQGAGQGPVVRTATLRDFRVPPYAQMPVEPSGAQDQERPESIPAPRGPEEGAPQAGHPAQAAPAAPVPPPAPVVPHGHQQEPYHQEPPAPYPVTEQTPYGGAPQAPQAQAPQAHAQPQAPQAAQVPVSAPEAYEAYPARAAHPGNAVPEDELPEGYTPTERDLPVISRAEPGAGAGAGAGTDTGADAVPRPASGEQSGPNELGPLYVVGDVHGYLDELVAALAAQGLIDAEGNWAAGNARLWFLGDFTDRGPDGIGVIDLVMRLSAEAAAAGGYCKALMGNHELLLLGAKRFVDTPVNSGAGTATFQAAWLLNGGQKSDMDRLQDVHVQWMARLDAVAVEDGHLLLHSDTTAYLDYGDNAEAVNDTIHDVLTRNDADECWDLFRKMTKRFAFRDETSGPPAVRELLAAYGGTRVVHGHSPIPYLLGEVGTEEGESGERPVVEGPHVYADGLAIAMDGGVTMAGKLLVVQLPLADRSATDPR